MRYSSVSIVRRGRRPSRSSRAPTTSPSEKITAAGAVVLLLVQGEELEHVPHILRQRRVVLPGRRHEGDDRLDDVQPVVQHSAVQGLVEAAGVGLAGRAHDAAGAGTGDGLVGQAVLAVRVELAVVGHHPEGCAIVGCGSVLVEKRVWK